MAGLGLKGMASAFDEAVTTGLQRKRTTMEILTDLLRAEKGSFWTPINSNAFSAMEFGLRLTREGSRSSDDSLLAECCGRNGRAHPRP